MYSLYYTNTRIKIDFIVVYLIVLRLQWKLLVIYTIYIIQHII